MSQTNGLQPTQTSTSPAELNKENAGKQPGKSFTDGQSGLIPGEIQESAGGDYANWSSNDAFNHPVPVKHGKSAIINNPDALTTQTSLPVLEVAAAQDAARIGNTGPNVGSNDVGNIGIATFGSSEVVEKHVISGVNYKTYSGTISVATSLGAISIVGVYSGSSASTGSFPRAPYGLSGSGWSAGTNSVIFTNGAYTAFSGAATAGMVPASGADFYIDYTYQTVTPAATTASFTGVNGDLTPNYIPNVGNRFAR